MEPIKLPGAIKIPIQTLTPILTGDCRQETSYLRATSFLGGVRFWTEALLRSLGEYVCNITGEQRCVHDPDNGVLACAACRIFGCTGLGRSFGLKVENKGVLTDVEIGRIELPQYRYRDKKTGKDKIPTWYLSGDKAKGKFGNLTLSLYPIRYLNSRSIHPAICMAVYLVCHWGTLGAKNQYGYGLVKWEGEQELLRATLGDGLTLCTNVTPTENQSLPNLSDFFFFSGAAQSSDRKLPFVIRYQVRAGLRTNDNNLQIDKEVRHYFCGDLKDHEASKFNVALHNRQLYGWGYFPRGGPMAGNRDRCLNLLKRTLVANCKDVRWKEFSSQRDTCSSSQTWDGFLQELIEMPWR